MSTAGALPDLLRRFVPTPYRFEVAFHSAVVVFDTNDPGLLAAFRASAEQVARVLESNHTFWHWKIVRDYDISQGGYEIFLLNGEMLTTLFQGRGTVLAIDWDRGEVLGFLSADASIRQLIETLPDVARRHGSEPRQDDYSTCIPSPTLE